MKLTTALVLAAVSFCLGGGFAYGQMNPDEAKPAAQATKTETKTVVEYRTKIKYKTKVKEKVVIDPDCLALRELAFNMMAAAEEIQGMGHTQNQILSDARKAINTQDPVDMAAVQEAQDDLTGTGLTHFIKMMEYYQSIDNMKGCRK